jgi:Spy/CpxP family protein refolding chaperone
MRRSNLTMLLYLLLVFASGAVLGAFASRLYSLKTAVNARPDFRRQYVEDMRSRLHLTPPQVTQLEQIMDATHQRMREARKTIDEEHAREVRAMLDDNQKAEYAKMRAEREQRHRRGEKGP